MSRAAALPLAVLLAGCGLLPQAGEPEPVRDPLSLALVDMSVARFEPAKRNLERVASACPAGASGTEALLLLSVLHLDPRNPVRDPTAAARYAARVVRRERISAVDLEVARGLYLAARDLGEPPLEGPVSDGEPPVREDELPSLPVPACTALDRVAARPLPRHPGPVLARSVAQAREALDSLDAASHRPVVVAQVSPDPESGTGAEEQRLRARVERLEAELARIRKLLRGGG